MNPETPQSPREEIEIRITALLMGELSPDEAAALQTQIAADADLTALHARLRRAAGLLREASAIPEQPASEPARLSDERRARLLAHFNGAKPGPVIVQPRRDWKWAVPLGLAASLIALLGGAVFVNGFGIRGRSHSIEKMLALSESKKLGESADATVNLQVQEATADPSSANWASQPGMIRVKDKKGTGGAEKMYAAYSAGLKAADSSKPKGGAASTATAANGLAFAGGAPSAAASDVVSSPDIDRSRLLLTARSRSPELNLAGRPRVATGLSGAGSVYLPNPSDEALKINSALNTDASAEKKVNDVGVNGTGNATFAGVIAPSPTVANPDSIQPEPATQKPAAAAPGFVAGSFFDTPRVQTHLDRSVSGAMNNPAFRGGLATSRPASEEHLQNRATAVASPPLANPQPEGAKLPALVDVAGKSSVLGALAKADRGTLDLNGTSAIVSGTAGLAKAGSGTLILSGANSYGGGTTINGGTLQITGGASMNPAAVPAAPTAIPGNGPGNNASLIFNNNGGARTAGNNVTQPLARYAGAPVTFGKSKAYAGDTTVSGGTLQIQNGNFSAPGASLPAATDDHFASYKTEGKSGVALGTAQSKDLDVELKGGTSFKVRIQPAEDPKTGETRAVTQESLDLAQRDLGGTDGKPASPTKSDTGFALEGANGDTNGRAASHDFDFQAGVPFEFTKSALGDQSASKSLGLGSEQKLGDIRVDYGMPLKDAAGSPSPGGKFQFNEGYKFGGATPEEHRKDENDPSVGAVNSPSADAAAEVNVTGNTRTPADVRAQIATRAGSATVEERLGRIKSWNDDETAKVNVNPARGVLDSAAVAQTAKPALPWAIVDFETGSGAVMGSGAVSVNKSGAGTWQLEGANTFTGSGTTGNRNNVTVNGGGSLTLSGGVNSLNTLTVGDAASGTVITKSGQRARSEVTREFKYAAETNAPETPKIAGPAGKPGDVAQAAKSEAARKEAEKAREAKRAAPKAAPIPLIPQPEIATSANAFSTFSLNVSDVAFKLAAASLERGVMPDVSTLRTEEFINAFDYRDPEPAPGAPLAFASERARYPFAQNRDVVRFSVKTAAAGRQPGKPLNVVLLLDNSGSMERADRVRIVREGLRTLSAQLTPQDKLSIVTFSRTPRLWADGVAGDKAAEVTARVAEITPEGGTNLAAALDLGYATALKHYQPGSINHVVMLTDGAANLGDVDPAALKQKVEAHRKQGIALDCFGVGWEGLNDDMLEQLSRNGDGRYGFINTPEEAVTNFAGQLAGALHVAASDVKVQVEWNPKRVMSYRQVGYAKHQLTKEQFRDNTVDAAELAVAESGNALYIVEVNPQGTGDLGTVRVRFKVPGTSDYREHEWAVPFTRVAASLEQSSSTLRLAASTAAFSEMLAGSPFAAEVTSDRLLGLLNGVPAIFGADARPQKLEWMIRQAKSISGR